MPTKRKQKNRARKSREADMSSDIENLDIMLDSNHFERGERRFSNSARRSESPRYNTLKFNESNSHSNSRENEIRDFAGNCHN